jgi:hypothetical protein
VNDNFDPGTLDRMRKAAGLQINPATAEITWKYGNGLDPYGDDPELPDELVCIGRIYFAEAPGSGMWVWFGDLPEEAETALWERLSPPPLDPEAAATAKAWRDWMRGTSESGSDWDPGWW